MNNQNEQQDYGYMPNMSPYGQYPMPSEKADLLEKIKPDLIVEVLLHRLMGEERINNKWIKVPGLAHRALSITGAWDIATLMLSASNQNVSISKLKDRDIRNRTQSIVATAIRMCLRNWKEYGITGSDQIHFVKEIVFNNTFITLKHPDEAGIQRLLKDTTQEVRSISEAPKKEGLLSSLIRR